MNWLNRLLNRDPLGAARSPKWPEVRKAWLKDHPTCACCGGTKKLNVHHKEPFHKDPSKELDNANLITLCEANKFMNCHLAIGHLGNFKSWNVDVEEDAKNYLHKFTNRP